jgi:4-coumarate--CoA ligase
MAFVVAAPGEPPSVDEITEYLATQLAHYKQVRYVEFVDAIPKSASGKILRRVLRDGVTA